LIALNKWGYVGILVVIGVVALVAVGIMISPPASPPQEGWVGYNPSVTQFIGGKYNTTLILMAHLGNLDSGDILYTRDGVEHRGYFFSGFQPAMDFLKTDTPENSTIVSWWDYGNMIIGYSERNAIAINPSESLLQSVTNSSIAIETDPEEKLQDIAKILTATDPQEALTTMKKYNAEYIFVASGALGDEGKANWIFYAGGVPLDQMSDYWVEGQIGEKGMATMLYKMLNQQEIPGFHLDFADADSRIYRAIE
jgi:hypothetical protein